MVAHEGLGHEMLQDIVVAAQGPFQFEEVLLLQAAPDRLPQFILGDRVDAGFSHVLGIVAMDHLAENPGIGVGCAHLWQDTAPERRVDRVHRIQSPARNPPVQPVGHHLHHQISHLCPGVVQLDQGVMALEGPTGGQVCVPGVA